MKKLAAILALTCAFCLMAGAGSVYAAEDAGSLVVSTSDWSLWNWGTNVRTSEITENGMVFKEEVPAGTPVAEGGNHVGGFGAYVLNRALSTENGLSAEITIDESFDSNHMEVWFGAIGGQTSWSQTMNSFVFILTPGETGGTAEFYIRTVENNAVATDSYRFEYTAQDDDPAAVSMSIAQENGAYTVTVNGRAVTTEDRTTGDGETVDFSAAVAAMIETLNNAAYFGITQTYTEAPAADEQMQFTVRSVNGMKLVASSSEPVSDNALVGAEVTGEIEFTGTEWGANQMGTNPAEFYITDDGFVVENTLKAGVSLSDASGVAGGWAGMGTAVAEVNTLDEYSFRINIPKAYYQDETTYCTYDFWFADGSGNWTTASHIIFMRVNFNGADTTKGGTMLIQTLTSQGNGAFVGELDVQGWSFPALKDESGNATSELVVSIRKNSEDGNYYMYVNGYKLELAGRTCNSGELAGQAADLALKTQLGRMENGVFFNCSNGLNGTPSEDYLDTFTIQALNGEKIVNKVPDMTSVDRPAKPSDSDVTINSIKLSWNAPVYVGVDSYNFDFDGYIIEVQKGNDSTVIMTVKSPLDTRNYTFENLEADTRYHFTIYAVQGYDTEEPVRLIKYTSVTVTTDSEEKENQDKDPQPGGCGGIVGISSGLGVAVIAAGVACLVRKRKNTQAK